MKINISLIMILIIALIFRVEGQITEITPKKFGYLPLSGNQIMHGNLSELNAISLSSVRESGNYVLGIDTNASKIISDDKNSLRRYYYSIGIGLFEYFQAGVGYQIDSQYSFSVKYACTWLAYGGGFGGPGNGSGGGIAVNYFKNLGIFNKISFESIYYTDIPVLYYNNQFNKNHGLYIQISLAQENILKSKKFVQFYWYIGLGASCLQRAKSFIFPTIGVGFLKNN